jgi:RNA polymerase sigma factor (sigma-70 family)
MPYCKKSKKYKLGRDEESRLMHSLSLVKDWNKAQKLFTRLYDSLCKNLYNKLKGSFQPPADDKLIQDAFQDGWAKVMVSKDKYQTDKSAFNWIFSIILNAARDINKKSKTRCKYIESREELPQLPAPASLVPYDMFLRSSEVVGIVKSAIDRISDEIEKKILILHVFQEWSVNELAAEFGLAKSTTYYKINKNLDYLRKTLADNDLNIGN